MRRRSRRRRNDPGKAETGRGGFSGPGRIEIQGEVKDMQDLGETKAAGDEAENGDVIGRKYLTFRTDNELFGIPIADVVQIIGIQEITPLPDFPKYVKGVINLRGNIIPVIDIRLRFGKPAIPYNEGTCIVVTRMEDACMGFIVDSVDEVTDLESDGISAPPKVSSDTTNKYLTGIGRIGERVVLLLDVGKILTESERKDVCGTAGQTAKPVSGEAKAGKTAAESKAAPGEKDAGGKIASLKKAEEPTAGE